MSKSPVAHVRTVSGELSVAHAVSGTAQSKPGRLQSVLIEQQMAKSKRNRRLKNRIEGAPREEGEGVSIKGESGAESAIAIYRSSGLKATRVSMFSAELEAVIDLIARDRVFRAMLAARGRIGEGTTLRLTELPGPPS